ncbi:glycosyltransferase [uncultured Eudoraea sp.]|uniref:glycosyltransferase n=1 Tax=uncultured Eudoraea sp. TaxID=1035614 RepID=UPI00261B9950|nr:glycosyltransferase [uncultured Eudoraea sp.]
MNPSLIQICEQSKQSFDLTSASDQAYLYALVSRINSFSIEEINTLGNTTDSPLSFRIAAKIIDSKKYIESCHHQLKIGVVFAMWGEQNRLQMKSENNPNGEDLLNVKIDQLSWLFKGSGISWKLYAVDDGCPNGSGDIAEAIRKKSEYANQTEVLFLEKALPSNKPPLKNLASADDSRKGGAILLGCEKAMQDGADLIIYTDADNSVHLGQTGLLLRPHLEKGYKVVLGNRKDPNAVLVKQENRWGIGIKALRHMQRMIGESIFSRGIRDSQAAFKLYHKDVLTEILKDPSVYDFSFDSDWIACVIALKEKFAKVPFAFIDSFAESASIVQGPMTTWETLLKGLVKAVRARKIPHNEEMAKIVMEKIGSHHDLELLINHLPEELLDAEDKDLGNPEIMSPKAMGEWIDQRKLNPQKTR